MCTQRRTAGASPLLPQFPADRPIWAKRVRAGARAGRCRSPPSRPQPLKEATSQRAFTTERHGGHMVAPPTCAVVTRYLFHGHAVVICQIALWSRGVHVVTRSSFHGHAVVICHMVARWSRGLHSMVTRRSHDREMLLCVPPVPFRCDDDLMSSVRDAYRLRASAPRTLPRRLSSMRRLSSLCQFSCPGAASPGPQGGSRAVRAGRGPTTVLARGSAECGCSHRTGGGSGRLLHP